MHEACGYSIELFDGDILHAPEMGDPKSVLLRKVLAEVFGVNFDGAEPAKHTEPHEATDGATSKPLWYPSHSFKHPTSFGRGQGNARCLGYLGYGTGGSIGW